MKYLNLVFVLIFAFETTNGAAYYRTGTKITGLFLNRSKWTPRSRQRVFIFSDCSSGHCIDYCNHEAKKLLPGETYSNDCSILKCEEDFSISFARFDLS